MTVSSATAAVTLADKDQIRFVYDSTTIGDLEDLVSNANGTAAYTYINYDFRSINGGTNDNNYYLNFTVGDASLDSMVSSTAVADGHSSQTVYNTGLVGTALFNSPGFKNSALATGSGGEYLTASDSLRVTV